MKRCPKCQSTYTDNALTYCLQDGASLVPVATAEEQYDSEKTWVIHDAVPPPAALRQTNPDNSSRPTVPDQSAPPSASDHIPVSVTSAAQSGSRRKTTALVAIIAILLLALGALGAWVLLRERERSETVTGLTVAESGSRDSSADTARPTPQKTIPPPAQTPPVAADPAQARNAIRNELNDWLDSLRARDINRHLSHYADNLEVYCGGRNVPRLRVQADRQRAFAQYDELDGSIENLNVAVEPSGTRAVATFDKHYAFRGAKTFSGVARSSFTFAQANGRWLIVGERDRD